MPEVVSAIPVQKGWSPDEKYCLTMSDGSRCFCRAASLEHLERRQDAFQRMCRAAELGIPMPQPLGIFINGGKVYTVESWIDGMDAEHVIPMLPQKRQYILGQSAGEILRRLHTIPAPIDAEDWETRFNRKIDRNIQMYRDCPLKYENGEAFLTCIRENRHLLHDRPQCYQHGDYHIGNMLVDNAGKLTIIDFDRDDHGDPWEEFNRIVWCAQASPNFASGMIDGYFGGQPPAEFWHLLALYISSNTLSSLPWAVPFGAGEVAVMKTQANEILSWYDNMKTCVPSWYFPGAHE